MSADLAAVSDCFIGINGAVVIAGLDLVFVKGFFKKRNPLTLQTIKSTHINKESIGVKRAIIFELCFMLPLLVEPNLFMKVRRHWAACRFSGFILASSE